MPYANYLSYHVCLSAGELCVVNWLLKQVVLFSAKVFDALQLCCKRLWDGFRMSVSPSVRTSVMGVLWLTFRWYGKLFTRTISHVSMCLKPRRAKFQQSNARGAFFKIGHISATVKDRAKVLLITNMKWHILFQMRWKSLTLELFWNRNCIGCSASSLAIAGLFVSTYDAFGVRRASALSLRVHVSCNYFNNYCIYLF